MIRDDGMESGEVGRGWGEERGDQDCVGGRCCGGWCWWECRGGGVLLELLLFLIKIGKVIDLIHSLMVKM